ncbi:MAG: DUF3592 domain-containing protein [Clostridia bacterium]|nr:DUF3592 domain-containing protein [Clostridia bacterium]
MIVFPILATVYGAVTLLIGLIFLIPLRYVTTRFDRTTTGKVIDLTRNAAKFNQEQGHEPIQVGGKDSPFKFEVQIGGRSRVSHRHGHRTHISTSNMYHKVYTYTVNGQAYTRADGVRYSKGLADKWLEREVPVYYDSADPAQASLSNGKGYRLVCCILIPIGIVLLAVAAYLWMQVL